METSIILGYSNVMRNMIIKCHCISKSNTASHPYMHIPRPGIVYLGCKNEGHIYLENILRYKSAKLATYIFL